MSTKKSSGQRLVTTLAGGGTVAVLLGALALVVPTMATAQVPVADAPGGNNGFIKVEGVEFTPQPDNHPHQGCTFTVEFYNYDKADEGEDLQATVSFTDQAPTADGGVHIVSGDPVLDIGEDAAGGGNDLDAKETYTLDFTGEPHPVQGFHIKLTIHADGSQGADTKHKVFWVEGCGPTTPPTTPPTSPTKPPTTPPPTTVPPTTVPPTTVPPTTKPTSKPPTSVPPTTVPPTQPTTGPTTGPTTEPTEPDETTEPPVPTDFDAGLGGTSSDDGSNGGSPTGPAGIALLSLGGMLLAVGGYLGLRRRGRHTV